jgi:Cytochrome P450
MMSLVVQPGTLILPDTFPAILKLPTWMQPWYGLAKRLTTRELKIHKDFINNVKNQEAMMAAPDCYGKTLLKVSRDLDQTWSNQAEISEWQEAKNIDDGLVLGILAMLIGAGSDTTSTVLQNFFKIMALHPHVAACAQKGSLRCPLDHCLLLSYRA